MTILQRNITESFSHTLLERDAGQGISLPSGEVATAPDTTPAASEVSGLMDFIRFRTIAQNGNAPWLSEQQVEALRGDYNRRWFGRTRLKS